MSSTLEPPLVRRVWRRRLVWAGLILAVLAIVPGWLLYQRFALDAELRGLIAEIDRDDPGWRIEDLELARSAIPDSENAAFQVLRADQKIPNPWLTVRGAIAPGLLETFAELPPQAPLSKKVVADVKAALAQASAALPLARRVAEMRRGRYPIVWSEDGIGTLLPHLEIAIRVAQLLSLDAALGLESGDADGALESSLAMLNVARSIGDEPCALSQMVRARIQRMAVRFFERTLARAAASEPHLARAQALLAEEAAQPLLLIAARSERAMVHEALKSYEARRVDRRHYALMNPLGMQGKTMDQAMNLVDCSLARAAHAPRLRYQSEFVEIAKLPSEQRAARLKNFQLPNAKLPPLLQGLLEGGKGHEAKIAGIFQETQSLLRTAATALAVERYRLKKQVWPETLAHIVPDYQAEVFIDPYDGAPLRYARLVDGVVIYAVGADGKDDGGKIAPESSGEKSTDVGFRLWHPSDRLKLPAK